MFSRNYPYNDQPANLPRRRLLQAMLATAGAASFGTAFWVGKARAATAAKVRIALFSNSGKLLGVQELPTITKTEQAWRQQLSPLSYYVTREGGTERAFSGRYKDKPGQPGIYRCICCDTALFNANTQFHSGTGWPSFWQPIAETNLQKRQDKHFGLERIEVRCKRCDAHLGHVFHDGPPPTGLRYCMNSVALHFFAA